MSSSASIIEENLQGFLEILIPSVECLGNRPANQIPKVKQEADQKSYKGRRIISRVCMDFEK
jgi:hypothetical protein